MEGRSPMMDEDEGELSSAPVALIAIGARLSQQTGDPNGGGC